jgi:hypothetical protein
MLPLGPAPTCRNRKKKCSTLFYCTSTVLHKTCHNDDMFCGSIASLTSPSLGPYKIYQPSLSLGPYKISQPSLFCFHTSTFTVFQQYDVPVFVYFPSFFLPIAPISLQNSLRLGQSACWHSLLQYFAAFLQATQKRNFEQVL